MILSNKLRHLNVTGQIGGQENVYLFLDSDKLVILVI